MRNLKIPALLKTLPVMLLQFPLWTAAQEINKEVYVVRPYEPALSDASKFIFMPESNLAVPELPAFNYSVSPKRLESSFVPDPIKPAKTTATSLPKIYNSWIKLGLGNYNTPLAAFNISNLRARDYAYGAYLYHKSSKGNVRLFNDDKVAAGYAENNINLYGKRFFSNTTLTGNLRFDHQGLTYYGYNTELFQDSIPVINQDSLKQKTYRIGGDVGLSSTYTDSSHLNYNIRFSYNYFWDRFRNNENSFRLEAAFNKTISGLQAGIDVWVDYSNLKAEPDSISNTVVSVMPYISKRNKDWKFLLGFEVVSDAADISHLYLYPHASLDIIIVENVLVPYIALSGEIQKNSYSALMAENEFIVPGTYLKNASSNLIFTGGVKGSITPDIRFRADVTYRVVKNMHFFVNDTLVPLQNQFTAEYDDIDLITYHGQLVVQPTSSLAFSLDGKYYDYNVFALPKPWHRPQYELGLDLSARLASKFTMNAGIAVIGTRWVNNMQNEDGLQRIKPVADLNLRLNYNYSKAFSLFADLYNIAGRSYLIWNQYPSQRFNFMFGLTYKL